VLEADVILHVRDVSHADSDAQAADVNRVLDELGLDEVRRGQIIEVWNKLDRLSPEERLAREAQALRKPDCVLVSALTGEGLDHLLAAIENRLGAEDTVYEVFLDPSDGKGLAWLHERGEVLQRQTYQDGRTGVSVRLTSERAGQAAARFGKALRLLDPRRAAAE
jgi:GTPase